MTTVDVQSLRMKVRPELERYRAAVLSQVPRLRTWLEETTTRDFPLTLALTMASPAVESDAVVEITLHKGSRGELLSAEVLTEDGDVLAPALVQRISLQSLSTTERVVVEDFTRQLRSYLENTKPAVVRALNSPEASVALLRSVDVAPPSTAQTFQERVMMLVSSAVSKELAPARVRSRGGKQLSFDLVSADRSIIGEIKHTPNPRGRASALIEPIFRLQQVDAKRRLLLIGPASEPFERWEQAFGKKALRDVEVYVVTDEGLSRAA